MERILPPQHRYPIYQSEASRQIEAAAIVAAEADRDQPRLMVRAGLAVARLAAAIAPFADRVWIAAGPGNNGGDGIEAACHLQAQGRWVTLTLAADAGRLPVDAATSLARAQAAGLQIDAPTARPVTLSRSDLAIDALLGLGSNRAPADAMAGLVQQLNTQPCRVLAIDLPTGIDGDTGQPLGDVAVRASHTLALLTLKPGLFTGAGRDHAGDIWLDDLGCGTVTIEPDAWLSGSYGAAGRPRRHTSHKGSFGDVVIVGGAPGMRGAAILSARAALAAGAGRVWVMALDPDTPLIDLLRPELMWRRDLESFDNAALASATVVCGCGSGEAVRDVLPRLLDQTARLVVDADALNAIADTPAFEQALHQRRRRGQPTILTPHPLEAARLLGVSTPTLQADRLQAADALAARYASVVVLKGSGSIIAAPASIAHINSSGNAALATPGSGDVLAGWLGGIWSAMASSRPAATRSGDLRTGQQDAFNAAVQAVWWHGASAELAGVPVLRAGDLIDVMASRRSR